jgi:hypothetical protein
MNTYALFARREVKPKLTLAELADVLSSEWEVHNIKVGKHLLRFRATEATARKIEKAYEGIFGLEAEKWYVPAPPVAIEA